MRQYVELPASVIDNINFELIMETSASTVRWSDDKSTFFVKYLGANAEPSFTNGISKSTNTQIKSSTNYTTRYMREETYTYHRGHYIVIANAESITEGGSVLFQITADANSTGEEIPYDISGVGEENINVGLSGILTLGENLTSTLEVVTLSNSVIEEPLALIFTMAGVSVEVLVTAAAEPVIPKPKRGEGFEAYVTRCVEAGNEQETCITSAENFRLR